MRFNVFFSSLKRASTLACVTIVIDSLSYSRVRREQERNVESKCTRETINGAGSDRPGGPTFWCGYLTRKSVEKKVNCGSRLFSPLSCIWLTPFIQMTPAWNAHMVADIKIQYLVPLRAMYLRYLDGMGWVQWSSILPLNQFTFCTFRPLIRLLGLSDKVRNF